MSTPSNSKKKSSISNNKLPAFLQKVINSIQSLFSKDKKKTSNKEKDLDYLSQSTSIYDLESRMKSLEKKRSGDIYSGRDNTPF